jgi:hypothetical protein
MPSPAAVPLTIPASLRDRGSIDPLGAGLIRTAWPALSEPISRRYAAARARISDPVTGLLQESRAGVASI